VFEFPPVAREGSPEPIDLGVVTPGWQPVIARDMRPVGFRLVLRAGEGNSPTLPMAELLDGVLGGFVAEGATGFPHGLMLIAPVDLPLDDSLAAWSAPRNVLLEVHQDELGDAVRLQRLLNIQRRGVRLVLRVSDRAGIAREHLPLFQYLSVDAGAHDPAPRETAVLVLHPDSSARVSEAFKSGAHAVVGTRSLVTGDVPAHALAFGVPARVRGVVGDRSRTR